MNNITDINIFKKKQLLDKELLSKEDFKRENKKLREFKTAFLQSDFEGVKNSIMEAILLLPEEDQTKTHIINFINNISRENPFYDHAMMVMEIITEVKKLKKLNILTPENSPKIKKLKQALDNITNSDISILVINGVATVTSTKGNINLIEQEIKTGKIPEFKTTIMKKEKIKSNYELNVEFAN